MKIILWNLPDKLEREKVIILLEYTGNLSLYETGIIENIKNNLEKRLTLLRRELLKNTQEKKRIDTKYTSHLDRDNNVLVVSAITFFYSIKANNVVVESSDNAHSVEVEIKNPLSKNEKDIRLEIREKFLNGYSASPITPDLNNIEFIKITSYEMSDILTRFTKQILQGISMRKTGGVYLIPESSEPKLQDFINAVYQLGMNFLIVADISDISQVEGLIQEEVKKRFENVKERLEKTKDIRTMIEVAKEFSTFYKYWERHLKKEMEIRKEIEEFLNSKKGKVLALFMRN